MMTKSHNKKRNIGIIYDQMISTLCESYIDKDQESVKKIISIIKESFKKGTQLQKELQFFNSFLKTRSLSSSSSALIISEAKKACKNHFNQEDLDKEKSKLIKNLNYAFGKGKIFEKKVLNYKMYATIQTLLNEWRKEDPNFSEIVEYEVKLNEWLTTEESLITEQHSEFRDVDNITFKLMNDKFNKKYQNLTESQEKLIKNYITSTDKDHDGLVQELKSLKESTITLLNQYQKTCDNQYVLDKCKSIRENLVNLDYKNLSEENLKRFLTTAKLKDELESDA